MVKDNSELYRNPYANNPLVKTGYKERSGAYSPLSYSSNQDKVYDLAVDNIMSLYANTGSGNDVDYNTRFAIDSIISLATGTDYMDVARNHDMYARMFTGDVLEDKTIWKAFTDNFEASNIQRKIAKKQNSIDWTRDPEKIDRLEREIEGLERDLIKYSDMQDRGFLGDSFVALGSLSNQMLRFSGNVLLATALGALAPMKLASTVIGSAGFLKEGVKSVLKLMTTPNKLTGLGILYNKFDTFMIERGSASREMSLLTDSNGNHIDKTTRQIASTIYGIFSTAVEFMGNPLLDDFLKGRPVKKVVKDSVFGYMLDYGFDLFKKGTNEAFEEGIQSSGNVVAREIAKYISNMKGTEFDVSLENTLNDALSEGSSAFMQAFGPSLLIGVPETVFNIATNSFTLKHPVSLDKETIDKMRKETKHSYATPSNEDVAGIRLSVGTFQDIDEDATILDFDQIIVPNEAPSKDYSDYKKTETTEAQKLPTIDVVEDENNPGMYRALTDEDNDMLNWMFDKGSLGAAVNVLSTKNDSLKNVELDTLSEIADAMDFKVQDGVAVFENQEDLDSLVENSNIRFVSDDKSYINAIDDEGNNIQIPIKVRNTSLINSIVEATGGKISEQSAEALSVVLSSIKTPEGTNIGIKNVSDLDENTKALLKDKRGAVLVDKLEIVLSQNSDETTVEHEGFHIVDILDDEHRGQLVKAISEVAHDEKAYAELIDILYEHKNQLGGKTVEEFIEILERMDSTNENDEEMREARASLYEIWRETMGEEDYKKLPKNLSEAFKLIAESFKRIYNNLTGHKLDSRISDAFSQMYGSQNTSNKSVQDDSSILYQSKKKDKELDKEYMNAIESGDMEKVQKMVEQKAKEMGFENTVPEQTDAYTLRTKPAPKKTIKVYKLFTVDKNGDPTALFVAGTEKLPRGVWIDAVDTWHFTAPNGKEYIPSTQNPNTDGGKTGTSVQIPSEAVRKELIKRGYLPKGSKAKTITGLAYRPGWHAGDEPFFPQGGIQDSIYTEDENAYVNLAKQIQEEEGVSEKKAKDLREARYGTFEQWRDPARADAHPYKNLHRYNQVVFECEMSIDNDYTETSDIKKGKNKGKVQFKDRQEMPVDGSYRYATNPATKFSDKGVWYIGGTLKINRPLTEAEANRILEEDGFKPQAWENGSLDLESLGVKDEQDDASRKTLAPITYDEEGNIIPLSERFDSDNPSILFQSEIDDEEVFEDYEDPYWDAINEEIEEVEEAMLAEEDDILKDIEVPEITKEGNRPVPQAIQKKNEAKAEKDLAKGKVVEPKEPAPEKPRKKTIVKENLTEKDLRNLSRRFEHNTAYSSFTTDELVWLVDAGVYVPSEVLVDVYNRNKDRGNFVDSITEELKFRGRMIAELGDLKDGEAISIIKQAETVEQAVRYMRKYYGPENFTAQREDDVRRLFGYVHTPTLSQMRKDFLAKFATRQGVENLMSFYSIHPIVRRNEDGTISQKLVVPTKSHSYNKLNEKHAGGWTDAHYNDVIEDMKHHTSQWVRDYLHQKASFEAVQYNRSEKNPQMMKTQAEIAFLAFSHADDSFLKTVESMQVGENIAESKELKSLYNEIQKNNNEFEKNVEELIKNIENVDEITNEEKERIKEEARNNLESVIEKYSEALASQKEYYKGEMQAIRSARDYKNKRRLIQNGIKRLLNVDLTKYDFYAVSSMSFVYNLMHNKFAQYQFGAMNDAEYFEYRTLRGEEEQNWIVFNNVVTTTDAEGNEVETIKDVEFNEGADLKSIQEMPDALRERLPQELIDKIEKGKDNFRWLSLNNDEMLKIFDALSDIKQEARTMKLYKDTKKKLDKQRMAIDAASSIRKSTTNEITDEIRQEYYDRTGTDESKKVSDNEIMIWYLQNIKAFDGETKEFGMIGSGKNKLACCVGKIHRLARFLDGNKEGAIYDLYVNKPTEALREEKRNSTERKARYSDKLQKILDDSSVDNMDSKAKQKFLRGKHEILMNGGGKKTLRGWDIVGISAYSRNFRGFIKLINPKGNNISLYEMARINPEATKKFLELDMKQREEFLKEQNERLEKLYNKKLNMAKKNAERRQYLEAQKEKWIKNNQAHLEEEISKKRRKPLSEEKQNKILEQYSEKEQEIANRYDEKIYKVDMFDYSEVNQEIAEMEEKIQKAVSNYTGVLKIGKEGSNAYNEEVDVLEKLNAGYDFGYVPSFVSQIADLLIETASERSDASQKYAYENENMILTLQEEYYPFISKKGSVDAVIGGIHSKKNVNNGNLKARLNTIYELDTNVGNNIFGIIDKQEHLIAFGQLIKDLNWIGDSNGGNLYSIVEQKFGKEMSQMLNDYVKDLAGMKPYTSDVDGVMSTVVNNASVSVLANPMVVLKQFLSLIPALTSDEITTSEWIQAFMLNNKSEVVTETYEHFAPEIAHGPMSVTVEQIRERMQKSTMSEFQSKAFQKMMFLAEFVDDLLKKTVWYAKFNHEINAMENDGTKIGEKELTQAANKASTLVKGTQSTTDILSQSKLQREMRTNVFKKLMFMFSNDVFNMWNIIYGDIPNAWKNGNTKQAIKMALGVTSSALILALLKGGWIPEEDEEKFDEKEFLKDFLLTSLGYSMPVIGAFAESWGSIYSSNLAEQLISDTGNDLLDLVIDMPLSDKDYEMMDYLDKVFDIALDAGKFVGAPTELIERLMKIPYPEGLAGGFQPSVGNIGYVFGSKWGNL